MPARLRPLHLNTSEPARKDPGRVKRASRWYRKLLPFLIVIGLIFIISFLASLFTSTSSVVDFVSKSVLSRSEIDSTDGRVNVLLLGTGGGKHDGPNLTDSIIIASYNIKTKDAILFSVPRDLWIPSVKSKVNAIYQLGIDKSDNELQFTKDKLAEILGLTIHYGVRIDFSGFVKAVDTIGGVDVEVPKTFEDYVYPIEGKENDTCGLIEREMELDATSAAMINKRPGKQKVLLTKDEKIATQEADFACRFEHITFKKGVVHLDGETALKFVRSRHGTNGEGSDFARSRRQQLVIEAFRTKALSLQMFANPQKVVELVQTFSKSIATDIPTEHYLDFYNLAKEIKSSKTVVLGDLGDGTSLFINPSPADYGGAWVLAPKKDDPEVIKNFVRDTISKAEASNSAALKE